jgi:hypothetical protein
MARGNHTSGNVIEMSARFGMGVTIVQSSVYRGWRLGIPTNQRHGIDVWFPPIRVRNSSCNTKCRCQLGKMVPQASSSAPMLQWRKDALPIRKKSVLKELDFVASRGCSCVADPFCETAVHRAQGKFLPLRASGNLHITNPEPG